MNSRNIHIYVTSCCFQKLFHSHHSFVARVLNWTVFYRIWSQLNELFWKTYFPCMAYLVCLSYHLYNFWIIIFWIKKSCFYSNTTIIYALTWVFIFRKLTTMYLCTIWNPPAIDLCKCTDTPLHLDVGECFKFYELNIWQDWGVNKFLLNRNRTFSVFFSSTVMSKSLGTNDLNHY